MPVLMYHHVRPEAGPLCVTTKNFAGQMDFLSRAGYQTIGAVDIEAFLRGKQYPDKTFAITFDDGYLDNWVYAYPILERYRFNALCFLVTDWPADGPKRRHSIQRHANALPECPDHYTCCKLILGGQADRVVLRWSEIQAMSESGTFEFHSHTHRHVRWDWTTETRSEKRDCLWEDLLLSQTVLRQRFSSVSNQLCWPYGYFDQDCCEIAREVGFEFLYTCHRGTNRSLMKRTRDEHILLNRIEVRDRPASWLASRLCIYRRPWLTSAYLALKRYGVAP